MAACCSGSKWIYLFIGAAGIAVAGFWGAKNLPANKVEQDDQAQGTTEVSESGERELATFGGGCFWCVEAVFQELNGVHSVKSGYSGGHVENPTYEQICQKNTGHAEVCQIEFDPAVVTFDKLLEVFWKTHDPTTLNRQGNDIGPQYRSVIYFHDDEQKETAEAYKKKLNEEKVFKDPVVTEISEFEKFYVAEREHQDFYSRNPNYGYCQYIIVPKMKKFREVFADDLKKKK